MLVVVLKHRMTNATSPLPADICGLYQTAIEDSASHAGSGETVPLLKALATANLQAHRRELTSSDIFDALRPSAAQSVLWDQLEARGRIPLIKTVESDKGLTTKGARQCTYQFQHISLQDALVARAIVETHGELIAWSDPDAAQAFITDPFNANLLYGPAHPSHSHHLPTVPPPLPSPLPSAAPLSTSPSRLASSCSSITNSACSPPPNAIDPHSLRYIGGGTLGTVLGGCRPVWSFEGAFENVNALQLLPANHTVRSLSIRSSGVTDAAIEPLAECLERNQAELLSLIELGDNDIGVMGAGKLARALESNTTLTVLSLAHNRIEDAGVIKLATSLAMNTKLRVRLRLLTCGSTAMGSP